MHRKLCSFVVATAFFATTATSAFAGTDAQSAAAPTAPAAQQGALAPGGAAGVHQAQFLGHHPLLILLGIGVIAGGVALAVSGHGHSSSHT